MNESNICAILCAAGTSSRMGVMNKLMMPYKTGTLLTHSIEQLIHSPYQDILVVLGHEAKEVYQHILPYASSIRIVVNDDYEKGHLSSIQTGIKLISGDAQIVSICLSDMPLLTQHLHDQLVTEFKSMEDRHDPLIMRPVCDSTPGHPVIMHREIATQFVTDRTITKANVLIKKHRQFFRPFETCHPGYFTDIDTEEDLASFKKRFAKK